jgi:hypothetical protein
MFAQRATHSFIYAFSSRRHAADTPLAILARAGGQGQTLTGGRREARWVAVVDWDEGLGMVLVIAGMSWIGWGGREKGQGERVGARGVLHSLLSCWALDVGPRSPASVQSAREAKRQ